MYIMYFMCSLFCFFFCFFLFFLCCCLRLSKTILIEFLTKIQIHLFSFYSRPLSSRRAAKVGYRGRSICICNCFA